MMRKTTALETFTDAFKAEERGELCLAIKLYKQASRLNFTPAQTNLGNIYDDVIVPASPARARYWYKKAANLGDPAGASCLAAHYKNAGKPRGYRFWLKRAAAMGEGDAISKLSELQLPR